MNQSNETPTDTQEPHLNGLKAYLNYQYPSTKGDVKLNSFCEKVAKLETELTIAIKERDEATQELAAIHHGIRQEFTQGELSDVVSDFGHFLEHHNKLESDNTSLQIALDIVIREHNKFKRQFETATELIDSMRKERDEARKELTEEKETIRLITTDPTCIGGTHYWIAKHDKMMDAVRISLEVNLKLEEKNTSLQTALREVVKLVVKINEFIATRLYLSSNPRTTKRLEHEIASQDYISIITTNEETLTKASKLLGDK